MIVLKNFGAWSEYITVPQHNVFPLPAGMSHEEGAAIPVQYLTAYLMLHDFGNLRPGKSVLVHMAAGRFLLCMWLGVGRGNEEGAVIPDSLPDAARFRQSPSWKECARSIAAGRFLCFSVDTWVLGCEEVGCSATCLMLHHFGDPTYILGRVSSIICFSMLLLHCA